MAIRTRTRRRSNKRRRNGLRTTGALIANPRRRRTHRRKNALAVRTNRRRRNALAVRTNYRRRKNALAVRTNRRRRNALAVRTNYHRRHNTKRASKYGKGGRWASKAYKSRHNPRKGRRAAPRVLVRYRNRRKNSYKRRYHVARRRNGMLDNVGGMLNRIPVVGPILSGMIGFVGPALFGAIGVEPTLQAAKYLGPYVPQVPSSLFYVVGGLLMAAIVNRYAPVSPEMRKKLAIGIASATGGVAYYKWRTGTGGSMAGELGLLEDMGDSGYTVEQLSGYDDAYADVYEGDAESFSGDLSDGELGALGAMLSGDYGAWGRRFPPRRGRNAGGKSSHAGQEGHRLGWLIKAIGMANVAKLAKMPKKQRMEFIQGFKANAHEYAEHHLEDQGGEAEAAGWGASLYAS